MAKKKKAAGVPLLYVPKNATLKQIYAIAKKEFTASDLQRFTEIEEGVPVEQILADMEEIQRQGSPKRKRKS